MLLQAMSLLVFCMAMLTLYGGYMASRDIGKGFWTRDARPAIIIIALVGLHSLIRTFV